LDEDGQVDFKGKAKALDAIAMDS